MLMAAIDQGRIKCRESTGLVRELPGGVVMVDEPTIGKTQYSVSAEDIWTWAHEIAKQSAGLRHAPKPSERKKILSLIADRTLTKKRCKELITAAFPNLYISEREARSLFRDAPRQKGRRQKS